LIWRVRIAARPDAASRHFLNDQVALKCLYLTVRRLDRTGRGRRRWMSCWKAALNAFQSTFEGPLLPAGE
jgi:transposase-like protein